MIKACKRYYRTLENPKVASAIKVRDLQALVNAFNIGDSNKPSMLTCCST